MAKRKQQLKPKAKYNKKKKTSEATIDWDDEDACEQIKSPSHSDS
jgi:hypothetical protein